MPHPSQMLHGNHSKFGKRSSSVQSLISRGLSLYMLRSQNVIREKGRDLTQYYDKTPTPTEQSKKQRDKIKTPPKTLITQLLRTDLRRSVGVTAVTQLVWLNRFTSAQPSH